MRLQVFAVLVGTGVLVSACAGSPARKAGGGAIAPASSDAPAGYGQPGALSEAPQTPAEEPSPAPAADDSSSEARASSAAPKQSAGSALRRMEGERDRRAADERPGLGTSWGETRFSRVSSEPFAREQPNRPFAVASLFYNDAQGVHAMARRAGFSDLESSSASVGGGMLTVRLLDSNGNPLAGFSSGGRTHFVGVDGERYIIQLQNHSRERIEAVATVDGLDVIDGRSGSFGKRGYLLQPFSSIEIDGFRRSTEEVAAFRFGSVRDSYAARKGSDRNVGVIGVAFFNEAGSRLPWTDREIDRRNSADPFPGRFATPPNVAH
ncbi:MAG TPA: hypothetical protein VK524_06610 [Polyangiaceae bacterium]|nr:hypothetical protein [Polyangiaceae bacterium]